MKVEHLTNIRRIEDKVVEGEEITEFEVEIVDWDKVLKDHKERLENETKEREERLEKKEIKEKSWELYKECKIFLENNEKNWEKLRNEREIEMKRKERLARAREQQEITREKVREKKLEKEIREGIVKLPKRKHTSKQRRGEHKKFKAKKRKRTEENYE